MPTELLLIGAAEVRRLLSPRACMEAVEEAFRLFEEGRAEGPYTLGAHLEGGTFHVKAAGLPLSRHYFATKVNANYPGNFERRGLPTIQGVVLLSDGEDGRPLALLDSGEITALRTAAATAVAAKHLANAGPCVLAIVGCGVQGHAHLHALLEVLRVERLLAIDTNPAAAARLAEAALAVGIAAESAPIDSVCEAGVIVTCTTASHPVFRANQVSPGTLVAAVGADNEHKQELDPALMARSKVIVDVLAQCATIGELRHAIAAGVMTLADVHAQLGAVVASRRSGRESAKETIVFDSTGSALQDVAAAAIAYERASAKGGGQIWAVGS